MAKDILINKDRILITQTTRFFGIDFTSTRFDTNALYLKTDPNGSLSVGGYTQCPTFYGTSDSPTTGISDKDNGWFPTDVVSGNVSATLGADVYLDVPQFTSWKFVTGSLSVSTAYYSPQLTILRTSDNATVGTFNWVVAAVITGADSEGYQTTEYRMYPTNISISSAFAQSSQLRFVGYPPESCSRTITDPEYGGTYTQYFSQVNNTTDENGNPYRIRPTIPFEKWVLMFLKTPTTLSIAVTP